MLERFLVHLDEGSEQSVGIGKMLVELLACLIGIRVNLNIDILTQMRFEGLGFEVVLGHHALGIIADQDLHGCFLSPLRGLWVKRAPQRRNPAERRPMRGSDKYCPGETFGLRTLDRLGQAVRAAAGVQDLVERHVDDLDAQSAHLVVDVLVLLDGNDLVVARCTGRCSRACTYPHWRRG